MQGTGACIGRRKEAQQVIDLGLLEDFKCRLCEDFGIVEVWAEPAFGLASERHEAKTEWRVCECQKGEGRLAQKSGSP